MKKTSFFLAAMVAASWLTMSASQAEAGWGWYHAWKGGQSVYHGGRAIREARRDNPFGAVDHLLRFPTPTNPYRYLPRPLQERIQRDIRKIDPAHRYGPEYQDLFR